MLIFQATILALCVVQLIAAAYGTLNVENGLQISEMLPKGTYQHEFMVARQEYFSYYRIFVVTRNSTDGKLFDYSSKENQKLLRDFYTALSKVSGVFIDYNVNNLH